MCEEYIRGPFMLVITKDGNKITFISVIQLDENGERFPPFSFPPLSLFGIRSEPFNPFSDPSYTGISIDFCKECLTGHKIDTTKPHHVQMMAHLRPLIDFFGPISVRNRLQPMSQERIRETVQAILADHFD